MKPVYYINNHQSFLLNADLSINQKMNKLLAICGIVFIGNTATPNLEQDYAQISSPINEVKCSVQTTPVLLVNNPVSATEQNLAILKLANASQPETAISAVLDLNAIQFLEEEETIDLGFDTAEYLPADFNPNEVYFNLNQIEYVESYEEELLNFDVQAYLPENFNAYAAPADIRSVSYIEEEAALDFDAAPYLPEGFDPYEFYFDINSIEYIEDEDELDLDFNTQDYLPEDFNPHSR